MAPEDGPSIPKSSLISTSIFTSTSVGDAALSSLAIGVPQLALGIAFGSGSQGLRGSLPPLTSPPSFSPSPSVSGLLGSVP